MLGVLHSTLVTMVVLKSSKCLSAGVPVFTFLLLVCKAFCFMRFLDFVCSLLLFL